MVAQGRYDISFQRNMALVYEVLKVEGEKEPNNLEKEKGGVLPKLLSRE